MGDYGACDHEDASVSFIPADATDLPQANARPGCAIFFENPDGTITEAVPSSKVKSLTDGKGKPGGRVSSDGNESDASGGSISEEAAVNMYREVEFLYIRHQRIFIVLLISEFLLDGLYAFVSVKRMDNTVFEFRAMYNFTLSRTTAHSILWAIFVVQILYCIGYYAVALLALYTREPRHFRCLACWCLAGVVGLILLAYMDRFNLPDFFLRLLTYIYARFLQGLTAGLLLLPPAEPWGA
eukprot:TRINITY_DN11745_c1_g1_i1.p1 TRINITY_DN11745_c1_g1~~TRINITY_DN11745_c1_g1_i1.p1  ORF type:complete len:257 (-),score=29.74 TRINITY_DN11745_c1_g1_i1:166-885(-)